MENNKCYVGKIIEDNGKYRIFAEDLPNVIAMESLSDGLVKFWVNPTIDDKEISAQRVVSYCVTKQEFYEKITEAINSGDADIDNVDSLVSVLAKVYFRIPDRFLMLIAKSFVFDNDVSDTRTPEQILADLSEKYKGNDDALDVIKRAYKDIEYLRNREKEDNYTGQTSHGYALMIKEHIEYWE